MILAGRILLGFLIGAASGVLAGRRLAGLSLGIASTRAAARGLLVRMAVLGAGFWLASRLGTAPLVAASFGSLAGYALAVGSAVRVRHGS